MMIIGAIVAFRERPVDAMTDLYDAVAEEIIRSVIAHPYERTFHDRCSSAGRNPRQQRALQGPLACIVESCSLPIS